MHDEWAELSEIEARVTAQDRLDLHYERQDALDVQRGSWRLVDYIGSCTHLLVRVGPHSVRGDLLAMGEDWVQLPTALVSLTACDMLVPSGSGESRSTVMAFRQAVRQAAGRVPREVVLRGGQSHLMNIEWVGEDFLRARIDGRPALIPLAQIAIVFGRIDQDA